MDAGKAEIYRYVRDQLDKEIAAKESLISRFGNIRLLAGLLLTVFSFSIGVVAKTVENAHALRARTIALVPIVMLGAAIYYVIRALFGIPDLVGTVDAFAPGVNQETILSAFKDKKPNADEILEDLSSNYLEAVKETCVRNMDAKAKLLRCASFIRKGLLATIAFLGLTITANLAVMWLFNR